MRVKTKETRRMRHPKAESRTRTEQGCRNRCKTLKVALERLVDGQLARLDAIDAEYKLLWRR